MTTFLKWAFRVIAFFTALVLSIVLFVSYGERLNAAQQIERQTKLNKSLIAIRGNHRGQYGDTFSVNGTYIGDAKVVLVVDGRR